MLLALASAGRSSEINSFICTYMKLQDSFIHFELPIHTKTCRSGSHNRKPSFDSYKDDPNWCAVSCINHYINRTKSWREINGKIDRSWLILSMVKPHHPITTSPVARWLKQTIAKSGMSNTFTGYSTRLASTSKAKRAGLSAKEIIEQANWTTESTFMTFYCRPLDSIAYQQAVLTR